MKRDRKRALLKQARYERSRRRKYHWDGAEVVERVLGPISTPPIPMIYDGTGPARCLFDRIAELPHYMSTLHGLFGSPVAVVGAAKPGPGVDQ